MTLPLPLGDTPLPSSKTSTIKNKMLPVKIFLIRHYSLVSTRDLVAVLDERCERNERMPPIRVSLFFLKIPRS